MFTHQINTSYSTDTGNVSSNVGVYTGTLSDGYDGSVPASTTNQPVAMAWTHAGCQSLLIYSSQALTIGTNNAATPVQTLTLAAGQQITWGKDHLEPNPITGDVTQLFLTNGTTTAATVKIRVLSA